MGSDGELVGRDTELAAVDAAIELVLSGDFRGLALIGEPGSGKTALAQAAAERADLAGLTVLRARGTELETGVPFGMFVEALDGLLERQDPDQLAELGDERLAELATVFPSLAGLAEATPGPPAGGRFRFHHAVKALLEQLATTQPLLLALDDVHWADPASLELLAYLLRHRITAAVLLLYAYRPRHAPELLLHPAAAAAREESVTAIELAPLDERDAEGLLGRDLDADVRAALYRESGGNPFYLTELARATRDVEVDESPDGPPVPFGVAIAVAQEVASISADARTLLTAASVLGEPFELALAARVAELDERTGIAALDELGRLGLIRTTDVPGRYAFRQPIVLRAIYESAGVGFTLAAHRRAAELLQESGAPPLVRAPHVERSAHAGDLAAVELLTAAAEAVAPRAPTNAARWLTAALRLLPHDAPPAGRLELLIPLASALGSCGRVEDSRRALAQALPLLEPDQQQLRGRLVATMARLEHTLARHGSARTLLEQAIDELGSEPTAESTALRVELAMDHWLADDDRAATVAAAQAAARDAEAIGDRAAYATAASLEAISCSYLGEFDQARAACYAAAVTVDELPDAELGARIEALLVLSHAESVGGGRISDGARHAERGVALGSVTGHDAWSTALLAQLGVAKLLLGRLHEAREAADAALDSGREGNVQGEIWGLIVRCWVDLLEGEPAAAVRRAQQAVTLVQQTGTTLYNWRAYGCLALALLETGHPAQARETILEHAGGPELGLVERGWLAGWYRLLTLTDIAVGDLEGAQLWAERGHAAADAFPTSATLADAAFGQAALELARERPKRAGEQALQASEGYTTAERPVDAARARALAGRAWGRAGDRDRATLLLQQAHTELDACGARGYRDQVAKELRQLGERAPRLERGSAGVQTGPEALSAREREVAELVARGMTNRQIAEQLFLSPKTVESHLTHIFAKAGLPSRAAVAATVERWRREGAV